MGEEIDFSSVHPRVELERHSKFAQSGRNEIPAFLGVFQGDDETVKGLAGVH
jgi:hypothetical protein